MAARSASAGLATCTRFAPVPRLRRRGGIASAVSSLRSGPSRRRLTPSAELADRKRCSWPVVANRHCCLGSRGPDSGDGIASVLAIVPPQRSHLSPLARLRRVHPEGCRCFGAVPAGFRGGASAASTRFAAFLPFRLPSPRGAPAPCVGPPGPAWRCPPGSLLGRAPLSPCAAPRSAASCAVRKVSPPRLYRSAASRVSTAGLRLSGSRSPETIATSGPLPAGVRARNFVRPARLRRSITWSPLRDCRIPSRRALPCPVRRTRSALLRTASAPVLRKKLGSLPASSAFSRAAAPKHCDPGAVSAGAPFPTCRF